MSNAIKVGIVGLGRAGWGTIPKEMEKEKTKGLFEIAAVCDIIRKRVDTAVNAFGCKGYDCIEDLLKDPDVELVVIATRSIDHFRHAMMALKAGKNVVVEKPASINWGLVDELLAYGERKDTPRLYIRQNRRFESVFNEVLSKINSGILGTISEINIEERSYERRDDWQTLNEFGGGLILNWGPHIIDHAVILLGAPVLNQFGAMQRSAAGGDREDHFSLHLIGENGRKVNVWISGASALNNGRTFTVYGNRGAMVCHDQNVKLRYIDPKQVLPEVVADRETPGNSWGKTGTFEAEIKPDWIEEEYEVPALHFGEAMWCEVYKDFRGNKNTYPIKNEEVREYMKVLSRLRDGEKIWDMTANRDYIG